MAQQHIAATRDVPLVGHGHDGNARLGHDVKLERGVSQDGCGTTSILHLAFLLCLAPLI